ncbi:hypothetical protein DBA29_25660 [Xenophilus aerolatus]|nr:hypothetical protein [Xenophilus aerolatus]
MSAFQLLNHLFNFVLPALALAVVLALGARVLMKKGAGAPGLWAQVAINFVAGVVVLMGGLVVAGRDGRIGTYAVLVVVCGTVQWGVMRGWKR